MRFLGGTLEKIAKEKAGIIKRNVPVVIGETQEEVREVFIKKARELSAPISFADIKSKPYRGARSVEIGHLEIPLLGQYQVKNVRTAIQAIRILNEKNFDIDNHEIAEGINNVIQNTGIRGRWEVLSENPLTICDIGHNKDGIIQVVGQLNQTPHNKLHFVFGMVDDKNILDILALLPKDAVYYFCKADIPRGLDEQRLAAAGARAGLHGRAFNSVKEAFEAAQANAEMRDLVFVGGSTFVVAEVI
jgi:dihydrofolate synthase/folylpolyglutamate synthase